MDKNLWHFLDKNNMNLLYKYTDVLVGNQTYVVLKSSTSRRETENQASIKPYLHSITNQEETANRITSEQREDVYYLIWFIYYYVLNCKTLEQALEQDHIKILQEWQLYKYIWNKYIYIGGDVLSLPLNRKRDIKIILEILYNRYSVIEQYECYLNHYGDVNDKRTAICKEAIQLYNNVKGRRFYDDTSHN